MINLTRKNVYTFLQINLYVLSGIAQKRNIRLAKLISMHYQKFYKNV